MGQTTFTGPVVSQNGFIENSFTTAELAALPNPTEGLLVYNTTLNEYQVYNGSSFQPAFGPAAPIPQVTGINPPNGSTAGGTNVTITGVNFTGATAVTIGGTAVQSFSVINDAQINAVTGAHAAGVSSVNVTNAYGTNPANTLFTYQVPAAVPTISSFSIPGGSVFGGTTDFNISGTNFTGTTVLTFNGIPASFNVINDGTLQVNNLPSGTAGLATVVATNAAGSSIPDTSQFTYLTTPVITNVVPSSGSSAGGESLTIYGYAFQQMNSCQFIGATESQNANFPTCTHDTNVTITTPPHAPEITEIRGFNGFYGYGPNSAPIYTFNPSIPVIGYPTKLGGSVFGGPTSFNFYGSGFTGTTSVTFNGNPATYNVISDGQLEITNIPSGSVGAATVYITNAVGTSAPYTGWSYVETPVIQSVSPSSGSSSGGETITVYGYGLTQMSECQFIGATETQNRSGITPFNDTEATFTTPAHVPEITELRGYNSTYGYGPNSSPIYTFTLSPPVITLVNGAPSGSQQSGAYAYGIPSNANIAVDGTGFTGATNVYIGGQATGFTVNSDTSITINSTLTDSVGLKTIQVDTPNGSANYAKFVYTDVPVVTQMVPTSGSTSGGTSVSVYGYGFTTMNAFQFFGTNNQSVTPTVYTDSYATLTTPAYATAEAVQVRGSNPIGGAGAFVSGLWTFTAAAPTFTLGNILVSQGNPVAGAGNIAINQLTGTKMLIGQINNLKSIDFAGSFGPWNPTGTSSTPTTEYTSPFQTGSTDNLGFTLNGNFFVSWDYSANQFWGYETVTTPWNWTSGVTVTGPISVPSFAANFGVEAAFTLDYSGNKLYISNLTTLKQYNLPSQYNISNVNNGADDIYDISVDGILSDIKAVQWNNAGTHVYLLVSDGKIWRYTASSAFVVSSLNSPVQIFDANDPLNTSTYGTPDLNYHSVGMSVKADSEDRILLYMHTSFLNTTENYLIQLTT